jgi:hypothetical protein
MMHDNDAIPVFCTDNGKTVQGYILNLKRGQLLETAINTVRVRMPFYPNGKKYIGNMAGLEFVVKETDLPVEYNEPKGRR